jgi:hypothetical protein
MVVSHLIEPMIPWHMVPLEAESKESNKKKEGFVKRQYLANVPANQCPSNNKSCRICMTDTIERYT